MIAESQIVAHGMTVSVRWTRRGRGYTAELLFEGGDRAMLDAASLEELESLVALTAGAAVLARTSATHPRPQRDGRHGPAMLRQKPPFRALSMN